MPQIMDNVTVDGTVTADGFSGPLTGTATRATADASGHTITTTYATKTEVAAKQNTLVSGTNIKTVNGESLLGSGDLEIGGGGNYTMLEITATAEATSVTVYDGTETYNGEVDQNKKITFLGLAPGAWKIADDQGGKATVTIIQNRIVSATLIISPKFEFTLNFNSAQFATDPTGCLTYADDCAGFVPVSGPGAALAKCSEIGSWVMNADGTSTNRLLNKCFYATFTSAGLLHEKLNPQDLTQKIAVWNDTAKAWEADTGASSIATENTMFCIPTLYLSASSDHITISDDIPGVAYAHTIGGHTYEYLGIGVYVGYNDNEVLKSISGVNANPGTGARSAHRARAQANTVQNGHAMVWNFYQWNLWRILTIFAIKSFDGQSQIGNGGLSNITRGICNALGPFAGSTKTTLGSSGDPAKCFIEMPWCGAYGQYIDDVVVKTKQIYAGQNISPGDTLDNKTNIGGGTQLTGTAPGAIHTDAALWGIGNAMGGSATTGLCDYQYIPNNNIIYAATVGGSFRMTRTDCGPSYFQTESASSSSTLSSRLAYVFDLEASS